MNSFYLYSFKYRIAENEKDFSTATVIFCSCENIDEAELQAEIRIFYQHHYQPDEIFVIGSKNAVPHLIQAFITNEETTFKGIPKKQETHLHENLYVLSFDKQGVLTCENEKKIPAGFLSAYINEGLQQIFICRGGLIISEDSHHYVFPSGKHCDRFLRTGNILLYSPEIYFIAFSLLRHFDDTLYSRIYCDTSSINSIAFALFDLKNSFLSDEQQLSVSIESFRSYDGLYKSEESYTKDSFLLISASTSSNIVKYVLDNHKILERDNVIILYYLGKPEDFNHVKDQVLCNLTQSEENETGIPFYRTYLEKDCEFCKKGSFPVPVSGDVFLLEKPKVQKVLLSVNHREKGLSAFVQQFMADKKKDCIFKSHFKEDSPHKYEVYIDFVQILKSLGKKRLEKFKTRLDDYIVQYVPANTPYIVHLNDDGSRDFGLYILSKITSLYTTKNVPVLLDQDQLTQIPKETTGSILVVGSCISNGKNLLYISRALRKYDKLKIIYFTGITRSSNAAYLKNLTANLQRGKYGADTNSFISVQTMYCSSSSRKTPWTRELEFLKSMIQFINNKKPESKSQVSFFEKRRTDLEQGAGDVARGMTQQLFYPRITTAKPEELELRKNFAFFDFQNYVEDVTQADVYFTICNIMNSLRNSDKADSQLKQAVYVRNLIDPHNFSRFNDGIIQASILRSASADELAFSIDNPSSQEMYNTLETMIIYHEQEQGEALLEFLYAIADKKLTLSRSHLVDVLALIESHCKNDLFQCFRAYIQEYLIDEPERLRSEPFVSKPAITV